MPTLQHDLQKFAETTLKIVTDAKANATIQPEQESFWKWKLNEFEYGESGITKSQATGQYVTEIAWWKAFIALGKAVSETAEFAAALNASKQNFPGVTTQDFERFKDAILNNCLSREGAGEAQRENDETIRRFLNDLSGGLVLYKAKVELQGVTLQPPDISLDAGISIRQPVRKDLEKTLPPIGLWSHTLSNPSAILEVELRATRGRGALLQAEIERCVALLRLFNVGSVKWVAYETRSESLLDMLGQGTLYGGGSSSALENYYIDADSEGVLKRFWHTMSALLPKDVYALHSKQVNHITLAYDRYSDGLLQNGIVERRIANAVMGLEALFLEEAQELSYRLGLRIAKTLSLLGRNPLEVREVIQDAYAIRSAFAHGGHLTYKAKKKLESKHGEVKKLLCSVLDYLRLSTIVMILSRISKDEFVDLVDDSLLDANKHQQLQNRVSDAKTLVGV